MAHSLLRQHRRTASGVSTASFSSVTSAGSIDLTDSHQQYFSSTRVPQTIQLSQHAEWSANKRRLTSCSLKSRMNLRRVDSGQKAVVEKDVELSDYTLSLSTPAEISLKPGSNRVLLKKQAICLVMLCSDHTDL